MSYIRTKKRMLRNGVHHMYIRREGTIRFEKLFERSLRRKAKDFLESGTLAATLTKAVLITAALGGVIAVGIMAPNLFKVLRVDSHERRRRLHNEGYKKCGAVVTN